MKSYLALAFAARRAPSTSSYSGSSARSVSATTTTLSCSFVFEGVECVTPSLARCVRTVGATGFLESALAEDAEETPPPRLAARPRASAPASFSLLARDGRVAAASADLTSPAVARVVVDVTTFAVAAASADAGLRVGRGMRVRNVAASSFPSRRLMAPGEGAVRTVAVAECAPSADASSQTETRGRSERARDAVRASRCARALLAAGLGVAEGNDIATERQAKKAKNGFLAFFFFAASCLRAHSHKKRFDPRRAHRADRARETDSLPA